MTAEYIDAEVIEESGTPIPDAPVTDTASDGLARVVCPECDREFTAKTEFAARGSLGRHQKSTHGPGATGGGTGSRRKSGRPPAREDQAVPIQVMKNIADEIPGGKGAPSEKDLTKAFARGIGTISVLAASFAAETDPTITTEEDRDAVTDYLSLAPEAASEIAYPFAKAFGKSRLNKRYGRALVDNIDLVSAGAEIVNYAVRWRRYLGERRRREAQLAGVQAAPSNGHVVGTPSAPAPVYYPPPGTGEPAMGGSPRPMQGHVVSPSDLRRTATQ